MLTCATLAFVAYICILTDQLSLWPVKNLLPYFPLFSGLVITFNIIITTMTQFHLVAYLFTYLFI